MEQNSCTNSELTYWLAKYILIQETKTFAKIRPISLSMMQVAKCQDIIGWKLFLEVRITKEICLLQNFHWVASPFRMNGAEWGQALHLQAPTYLP